MVNVGEEAGRIVLGITNGQSKLCEVMGPSDARELAFEIAKHCNKLQNWFWCPGGGPASEEVVHIDNHWYSPDCAEDLPTKCTECLVTTEGPDGRHVNVALFIPGNDEKPTRWMLPINALTPDGKTTLERIVAWSPLPRPSKRKASLKSGGGNAA